MENRTLLLPHIRTAVRILSTQSEGLKGTGSLGLRW